MAVSLLTAMYEDDADFTNTFRALSGVSTSDSDDLPSSLAEARHLLMPASHGLIPTCLNPIPQSVGPHDLMSET